MKNKWFVLISGKTSIRVRMIWSFIISLVIAMNVSSFVNESLLSGFSTTRHFLLLWNMLYVVLFVVLFILSFSLMTRRIVQDLLRLAEGLDVIARGNLRFRVPLSRKDELGTIADNINAMAEKLEQLIEKEREIERSKMDLITAVSHDLRTPLSSLIGYLELLKNKVYRNEQEHERFVDNTFKKAIQLKDLIHDLFEYTRLTSGDAKLEFGQIDVRELLTQMLAEFQPYAKELGVDVEMSLPFKAMPMAMDPRKMRRAIDNLLINALKFSNKPGVVRVTLEERLSSVAIQIENDGTPISKEQEALLFERFYKADHSRAAQAIQAGSGLGLSIAQKIVEQHGGTLSLVHSSGHYVFVIELPES
ncbi:HAMP domain-containing sensor histidine kinase [Cohnella sp. REN36]|uniref:HAMP domain-containing sensor histidine kinase n=1 Tax=Cohnella sp. REN36 TaxID=2887347 RepID=UPI001D13FB32|nr:HAMP domain-containing sensor histidine kinase [Cohnella sp. REN36]MCC3372427.1 HAMP domain-containing histidine kinase [Cohnella sp. REN36]